MIKTLIATPLKSEFPVLTEYLISQDCTGETLKGLTAPGRRVTSASFRDLSLIVSVGGHGKAQFTASTQYLIDKHGPFGLIVAAGVAGGLCENQSPGDVVIASETVEHDYRKRFNGESPPPRHSCCLEARKQWYNQG